MRVVIEKCNGCAACSLICPVNAITLVLNEFGFYQAIIDEVKCINCGKCKLVCDKCKVALYDIEKADHYVAVVKDRSILKRSSSGGLAYLLAKYHIESMKGIAYVVGYNNVTQNAEHFRCDSLKGLKEAQGSKYLQSYNKDAFLAALSESRQTILFGTPCQIAGFREALRNYPHKENYILIDIFCHGVPSTKLWRNHLNSKKIIKSGEDIGMPVFRENKKYFLHYKKYKKWYNQDAFLMLFLMTRYLNRSCYSCPYRRKSSADIRLGDLMSNKYKKLWYSPSCVCVNTMEGRRLLNSIEKELDIFPIEYNEINDIQQKESFSDPIYEGNYKRLTEVDITPEKLLGSRFYINYLKSFVKIPLILMKNRRNTDDLSEIIKRNSR